MQCNNCKKEIDNDTKFCSFCGVAVSMQKEPKGSVDLYFNNKKIEERKGTIIFFITSILMVVVPPIIAYFTGVLFWGIMLIGVIGVIGGIYYILKEKINQWIKKINK